MQEALDKSSSRDRRRLHDFYCDVLWVLQARVQARELDLRKSGHWHQVNCSLWDLDFVAQFRGCDRDVIVLAQLREDAAVDPLLPVGVAVGIEY